MYLKISNYGEVQPEAFSLIGASTKRGDNSKIGMFGSGNKYALAYFFRNDFDIKIFSGHKEIQIDLIPTSFGEEVFNVISINNKHTSITTDMGPKWTLWQAIREFYSNSLDEGVIDFKVVDDLVAEKGQTSIFIGMNKELNDIINNFDHYFAINTPFLYKNKLGKILSKTGQKVNIFRKGIRCYDSEKQSIFDYDFYDIDINESRLITSDSKLQDSIWNLLVACDNKVIVKEFLQKVSKPHYFESNDFLYYWSKNEKYPFSNAWHETLEGKYVCPITMSGWVEETVAQHTFFVPKRLYSVIIKIFGTEKSALKALGKGHVKYRLLETNDLEQNTIDQCLNFFKVCNYDIEWPMVVCEFLLENEEEITKVMGMAEDGKILISRRAFDKGIYYVASVIYEEHIHLKHGCSDESRHMQDVLIEETLTYMKKANSINL